MTSSPRALAGRGRTRVATGGAVLLTALALGGCGSPASTAGQPVPAPKAAPMNLMLRDTALATTARQVPGFLLAHGRFTTVDVPPGHTHLAPRGIAPVDVNDRGQIVGTDPDAGGFVHGFLLDPGPHARFTRIDVPGAKGMQPQGINDRGQVVGKYTDVEGGVSTPGVPVHGFLFDHGRYVRLDYPGSDYSQAFDLNDHGQVVGEYRDAGGEYHGYLWDHGRFRSIDAGAATGINDRGQIVGNRVAPDGTFVGYLLEGGRRTTIRVPGAGLTVPYGINDRGQIVGVTAAGATATTGSGFLRDAGGHVTLINRPGKSITSTFDVNDRGQIVGVAGDPEDLNP